MWARTPFYLMAAVAFVIAAPSIAPAQSFQGLGFLPGDNVDVSTGVNADGSVVVGYSFDSNGGRGQAFRWTASLGMVGLGSLPDAGGSTANGVNADGSVVVGASGGVAFRWTASTGMVGLGFLPRGSYSYTYGVNADGSVIVGYSNNQAFRWTASTGMVGLGFLPGNVVSIANGVNADGSVVVGFGSDNVGGSEHAFRWTASTGMVNIGNSPTGIFSDATALSADGSVVVGFFYKSGGNPEAFRWTASTGMVGLGFAPGDFSSSAWGVNADGSVIVGDGGGHAVRWTASSGMQSIQDLLSANGVNTAGWNLQSAQAVSADGTVIFGNGFDPSGNLQAWIAVLPVSASLPTLQVSPATDISASGTQSGAFSPSLFSYSLSASGGTVNYTISGLPNWLTASSTSGAVTTSPTTVTFNVNANAASIAVGTQSTTITFTNSTNGRGTQMRTATLIVSAAPPTNVLAAVAPNARTTTVGTAVTGFATIINAGPNAAIACSVALPADVPANFLYQITERSTNTPVGNPNTPVNIPPGQVQSFYFAITPMQVMLVEIPLVFACSDASPAPVVRGLNTFLLTAGNMAIPDMLSISDTLTHDGNMVIPSLNGTGLIAIASIDIGAAGTVTFTPTDTAVGQPPRNLPITVSICQSNPSTGLCMATPGPSAIVTVAHNQTVTFSVFVQGQGTMVPYDPGSNRIFVIATQGTTPVGEASTAVEMLSGGATAAAAR